MTKFRCQYYKQLYKINLGQQCKMNFAGTCQNKNGTTAKDCYRLRPQPITACPSLKEKNKTCIHEMFSSDQVILIPSGIQATWTPVQTNPSSFSFYQSINANLYLLLLSTQSSFHTTSQTYQFTQCFISFKKYLVSLNTFYLPCTHSQVSRCI